MSGERGHIMPSEISDILTLPRDLKDLICKTFDLLSQDPPPIRATAGLERDMALLLNSHFSAEKRCKECPGGRRAGKCARPARSACAPATCTHTASAANSCCSPVLHLNEVADVRVE